MDKIAGFIVVQSQPHVEVFHGPFVSAEEAVGWMIAVRDDFAGTLSIREIHAPRETPDQRAKSAIQRGLRVERTASRDWMDA